MTQYEILQQDFPVGLPPAEIVLIYREDGSFESFPVDETNPRYIQFLEEVNNG